MGQGPPIGAGLVCGAGAGAGGGGLGPGLGLGHLICRSPRSAQQQHAAAGPSHYRLSPRRRRRRLSPSPGQVASGSSHSTVVRRRVATGAPALHVPASPHTAQQAAPGPSSSPGRRTRTGRTVGPRRTVTSSHARRAISRRTRSTGHRSPRRTQQRAQSTAAQPGPAHRTQRNARTATPGTPPPHTGSTGWPITQAAQQHNGRRSNSTFSTTQHAAQRRYTAAAQSQFIGQQLLSTQRHTQRHYYNTAGHPQTHNIAR